MSENLLTWHVTMVEVCRVKNSVVYSTSPVAVERLLSSHLRRNFQKLLSSLWLVTKPCDQCAFQIESADWFTNKCILILGVSWFCALPSCILLHPFLEYLDWAVSMHISAPLFRWFLEVFRDPQEKFHRIGGASPETFPGVKYDAPEELGGKRKCFNSPIRKWGVVQSFDVNSSRALTLFSLIFFTAPRWRCIYL